VILAMIVTCPQSGRILHVGAGCGYFVEAAISRNLESNPLYLILIDIVPNE